LFFSLDGKEPKDQADLMVAIPDDCNFPKTNRRNHPAIRRAQGRCPRYVLCDHPGGASRQLAGRRL